MKGLPAFVANAIASVSRWTLTGRKRKSNEQEPEDSLEPPVPLSASRPRLQGHQQQLPAPLLGLSRGPERLDFSSPAVNSQAAQRRAGAAAGREAGVKPSWQLQEQQHKATAAQPAGHPDALLSVSQVPHDGQPGLLPPPSSTAPFAKRFAPPAHRVAGRSPRSRSPALNVSRRGWLGTHAGLWNS